MKLITLITVLLFAHSALAELTVLKKVELATPSSFSCYDDDNSTMPSSISFYIGSYEKDSEGKVTFHYSWSSSESFNVSAELCKRLELIYSTFDDSLSAEERATTLFVNESDYLIGIEDVGNKSLLLLQK